MSNRSRIFGLGNPLLGMKVFLGFLDISAPVKEEFRKKYSGEGDKAILMGGAILAQDMHLPMYEELAEMKDVQYLGGGSTLNSIRVAQWVSGSSNGAIGGDKNGKSLIKCVKSDHVTPLFMESDVRTGRCACLIIDHERGLVADLAAANKFNVSHMKTDSVQKAIKDSKIFYSAGFHLTVSPESMVLLGEHCLKEGKKFCINLSAEFISMFFGKQLQNILQYVDILFGNEIEARGYGKAFFGDKDGKMTELEVAKKLVETHGGKKPLTCVFTCGGEPGYLVTKNAEGKAEVKSIPVVALEKKDIVDTNGCGDAFVGGFLAGLSLGLDYETCGTYGQAAASHIIRRSGTALNFDLDFYKVASQNGYNIKNPN